MAHWWCNSLSAVSRIPPFSCIINSLPSSQWWGGLVAKLCLTLCNPVDCRSPDSSAHGISQARILEWVAISFSRGSSWPRDRILFSCIACRRILYWLSYQGSPPIHRKVLNSLTWVIWFSLINNNLLMFSLPEIFLQNFYIIWLLPSPLVNSSLRVTWDTVSWVWSPKNRCRIKCNSQHLGCEFKSTYT